jgi:hypothetical protein
MVESRSGEGCWLGVMVLASISNDTASAAIVPAGEAVPSRSIWANAVAAENIALLRNRLSHSLVWNNPSVADRSYSCRSTLWTGRRWRVRTDAGCLKLLWHAHDDT